jgi:pyridinium-3,5-bisthiocarboxylic acid mononucleotide nickel chelatase
MKHIIHFDCSAGISGDMTVAALLDLGVPLEYLRDELARLDLSRDSYSLSVNRTERRHLAALSFDVQVLDQRTERGFAAIDGLIAASSLCGPVRERARAIFRRLAEAEALVHGVAVGDVHFHEVGAVDSIVDIVGTAICLDYLGVESISASALPLGSGFIHTAHGVLPVPAPATAELLKGMAVHGECGPGERVTPTGAAILAALATSVTARPAMTVTAIGSGAGSRDFPDVPNILRAFLGRPEGEMSDGVLVAETNIDDSTPELLGYVMELLLEAGALDVFFTPIQMKKNRPGVQLSFLCLPELLERLAALVLVETSAIGIRHYPVSRTTLERCMEERETPFGPLPFKLLFHDGRPLRVAPEYEACRRVARERGIPLQEVFRIVSQPAVVEGG